MAKAILVRYGEIALKGKNRVNFERKLSDNIMDALRGHGLNASIRKTSGRFIVYPAHLSCQKDATDASARHEQRFCIDDHIAVMKRVFGITSLSIAEQTELEISSINETALKAASEKEFSTFRITVQRLQKRIKTSVELEREIGAFIVEKTGKKVRLKWPDLEICVEIEEKAFVFTERMQCLGGLPMGIEGHVALIVDDTSKDSMKKAALSSLLMMKRGCYVHPFLITSEGKKSEGEGSIKGLAEQFKLPMAYGCSEPKTVKNLVEAECEASKRKCRAIVSGQILDDLEEIDTGYAVLRPLIAYDNKEIDSMLERLERFSP